MTVAHVERLNDIHLIWKREMKKESMFELKVEDNVCSCDKFI